MNYRLLARHLGVVSWLIGVTMVFSLPWAFPAFGQTEHFEHTGFWALVDSIVICGLIGLALRLAGRRAEGTLYRKEAMAIVGLSWILATILGALPYLLSRTSIGETADGTKIHMNVADSLFESQSGFSTTGATVLTNVEDPQLVQRCILFWRSGTHFLGGLGIIVLFVAVLGQGSSGKALMRAEMPGPSKEGTHNRMQHTAWAFAGIYLLLNAMLTILLKLEGPWTAQGTMSWFDALCHAFGTIATGGFSTHNRSVGYYNSSAVDSTLIVFMILSGSNFALLYSVCIGKPIRLLRDVEFRTYICWIAGVTILIVAVGTIFYDDFDEADQLTPAQEVSAAVRYGMFNIVSIMTTTGFTTDDFDRWNQLARSILFLSMFVGACAGSTSGSIKIIRHILFLKILRREVEQAYHPTVVRHLRLGDEVISDPEVRKNVLVYFGMVFFIFMLSWLLIVGMEEDATWTSQGMSIENKLVDVASAVISTFSNIGPGLGTVGATKTYAVFNWKSKLILTLVMMLGRVEIFSVLVLFLPSFWRNR